MNYLLSSMNLVNNHPYLTFVIILAIGLVWIYFQIPKIKEKTKAPVIQSTRKEWEEASASTTKYAIASFLLGVAMLLFKYALSAVGEDELITFAFTVATATVFLGGITLLFFKRQIKIRYLNNH